MNRKKNLQNINSGGKSLLKGVPFLLYLFSITAAFRFEIFIQNSSLNGNYIQPFTYLFDSFLHDGIILIFFLLVVLTSARYLKGVYFYTVIILLLFFYQHVLIFFSGYYMVFETPFTVASAGAGLSTFWYEILTSSLSEVRFRTCIIEISGILLLVLFLFSSRRHSGLMKFSVPLIPLVLFTPMFIYAAASSSQQTDSSEDYSNLIQNPLMVLSEFGKNQPVVKAELSGSENPGNFSTDSLVDKRMMPGIHVPRKKYNIIFYFAESTTSAYLDMKINGREVTPGWNRLSKNSIKFNRHYVQYPLSVNSLFNVLSSAYTPLGKKWIPMNRPTFRVRSVSEVVKQNGYRTALFHTGSLANFNHIDYLKHRKYDRIMDLADLPRNKYSMVYDSALDDRAMIQPSIDFMKKGEEPFFVAYFPYAPHHPYLSSQPELDIYPGSDIRNESNHKTKLWKSYINSLRSADECISELVRKLDENKLLDNTILFIFADHGEAFYQHKGNYLHSIYLYEENVHVPFIIYNKKLFPEQVVYNGISRHIDIVPTMLDMIGIDSEPEYEGISFLRPHQQRLAYSHTDWFREYLSVRDGEWKYILRSDNRVEELYNINQDPLEKNNVAKMNKDITTLFRGYVEKGRNHQVYYFKNIK